MDHKDIHIGAEVYWNDPDNGICSGLYIVTNINGDVVTLNNELEAFISELS